MAPVCVARLRDMPPGNLTRCLVEGVPICLARTGDGHVYAISDICTHEQASLADGEIVGTEIECTQHMSRFNLATGQATALPAETPLATYAVSIRGDDVYIELGEPSQDSPAGLPK
jgi:3-phenylpropionate/trans-cinnamate dioxygenase ferredoxin component